MAKIKIIYKYRCCFCGARKKVLYEYKGKFYCKSCFNLLRKGDKNNENEPF